MVPEDPFLVLRDFQGLTRLTMTRGRMVTVTTTIMMMMMMYLPTLAEFKTHLKTYFFRQFLE